MVEVEFWEAKCYNLQSLYEQVLIYFHGIEMSILKYLFLSLFLYEFVKYECLNLNVAKP